MNNVELELASKSLLLLGTGSLDHSIPDLFLCPFQKYNLYNIMDLMIARREINKNFIPTHLFIRLDDVFPINFIENKGEEYCIKIFLECIKKIELEKLYKVKIFPITKEHHYARYTTLCDEKTSYCFYAINWKKMFRFIIENFINTNSNTLHFSN